MTTEQLMHRITEQRQSLTQLEEKLRLLQDQCHHDFVEIVTYRECKKCLKMESIHY